MTQMVQVALAGDVTEAEELQELLKAAGSTPRSSPRTRRTG